MLEDRTEDEIGVLNRTLKQAIQAHEDIQNRLEQLVEQKTEALNESLERYRQAFEINAAVKLIVEPESGRIVDVNEAACAYYGYPRERFLSMKISEINILPEANILAEMALANAEKRFYFCFRHRLASGEVRDVEVYSGPLNLNGKRYLHSIVHDVTERKQAETALRQAEEKYRSVVESIKEVVFQTDAQGHWTYLNPAWSEITGFTVEEAIGQVFLGYVHQADQERNLALYQPLIERKKAY